MTSDLHLDGLTEAALTERSSAISEPDWLRDRRLSAYKRSLDQAWPDSRKDEFWRSTPFDRRYDVDRDVVTAGGGATRATVLDALDVAASTVRIVDGAVTEITVSDEAAQHGVVVADLSRAADEHRGLVEEHLGAMTTSNVHGTGANADRTVTVNDAAWTAGVLVHVPAEVELTSPLVVQVHVSEPGAHLPRVLAVFEHHARGQLYLEHTSEEGVDALVDEIVEVVAHDSANLEIVTSQRWGDGIQHLSLQKTAAHRNASVRHLSVTVGGATVRLLPEFDLLGPGAEVRPLGVYFADEGQWFDLQPYVRHIAPHATSDVLFKGALQGHSQTVFRGNVFVHADAVGTSTDENNRSLILTRGAHADSTPFLEIECADITAGHGSATGQIDARQLFYLESRGIARDDALRLIVFGFFREVLKEVAMPGIEDAALADIARRVESADLAEVVQVNDASLKDVG